MISPQNKTSELQTLFPKLHDHVLSQLNLCPVLLRSKDGAFTGSGVILTSDFNKGEMMVLTAKHNLWVALGRKLGYPGAPSAWQSTKTAKNTTWLQSNFKNDVEIIYKAADMSKSEPTALTHKTAIHSIKFPHAGFTYDVCILVAKFNKSTRPRAELFDNSCAKQSLRTQTKFATNMEQFRHLPYQNLKLIQAGFGRRGQGAMAPMGQLEFKLSELKTPGANGSYYQAEVGQYTDVALLNSTNKWTTLQGDSGGPLFAVYANKKTDIFLYGLTLGSDMFPSANDEPGTLKNDPDGKYNNAVTVLLPLYQSLSSF